MKNQEAKKLMGYNLQFFADGGEGATGSENPGAEAEKETGSGTGETQPTYEELQSMLEQANADKDKLNSDLLLSNADRDRYKLANDKLSKENKEKTAQIRNYMTDDEKAKADAQRATEEQNQRNEELLEEIKQLKTERRIANYSKKYMGIGFTDETIAENLAKITPEMEKPEAFFDELDKQIKAATKALADKEVQKIIGERRGVIAGVGGDSISLAEQTASLIPGRTVGDFNADALSKFA